MMAGKPGRSGGARPGAGRKPNPPTLLSDSFKSTDAPDPKQFLLKLMADESADAKLRADAAKSLMPYMHAKMGDLGKKDAKTDAAKKAAGGKFAPSAPPRLAAVVPIHKE